MARQSHRPGSFAQRLRDRREALEQELFNRVRAAQEPASPAEEAYVAELGAAISAGLDYGLEAIARGPDGRPPQIPDQLLLQARRAARSGINLDTVLRRYCAANSLFTDTLISDADQFGTSRHELKGAFRSFAISFERLLSAVSEEYARATCEVAETSEERRAELIERLLAGELIEGSELAYDFTGWHLGLVASGADALGTVKGLSKESDASLLSVQRRDGTVWAWLGARRRHALAAKAQPTPAGPISTAIAFGEPGRGLPGWRLTHRQAAAALPIAIKGANSVASYAQAPLLASALKDDLLATSLHQLYIAPLGEERDGGETARSTLRAYYEAAGNASSAAAALGVDRRTVTARLASIEERLGFRLDAFSAEIETALRLEALEQGSPSKLRAAFE